MNTTNKKQTSVQTSGYRWGEEMERGKIGVWDKEIQTTMYKIDKQQEYIV